MGCTLRRAVDVVGILGGLALAGGIAFHEFTRLDERQRVERVGHDVRRFEAMIDLHAATGSGELTGRGWPASVDPAWFDELPRNALISPDRPWLEIATAEERHLRDPAVRVAVDKTIAGFWYSPFQGVVRARVPMGINDRATLDLYNRINGTALESIYSGLEPDILLGPAHSPDAMDPPGAMTDATPGPE